MVRMSRALGLALMAVFALTALVASAAQAAPEFRVENASSTMPAEIKGEQIGVQKFGTVNGNVECNVANFTGTSTVTATTTQTLTPSYNGCTAFGNPANVAVNECSYTFSLVKNSSPATANVNINCPGTNKITVSAAFGCTTTVGSQTGKAHVVINNTPNTPTDIDAKVTVEGITYTATNCLINGTFNTGSVNGEATIRAYTEGVQQPLSVN